MLVGVKRKTFIVKTSYAQTQHKVKIGVFGSPDADGNNWNCGRARREAKKIIGAITSGGDPNAAKRARKTGPTVSDGVKAHVAKLQAKNKRPRSIDTFKEVEKYLADWLDRGVVTITRKDCRERHAEITKDNGPTIGNRVFRHYRALHNTLSAEYEFLPAEPCKSINWNDESRTQSPIPWGQLPEVYARILKLGEKRESGYQSTVRRDWRLVILYTGLRARDAASMRWENIDFEAQTLHRPVPKGGKKRAFDIPLSTELVRILKKRKELNAMFGDAGWVFPSTAGYPSKHKDKKCYLCEDLGLGPHQPGTTTHLIRINDDGLPSPHRFRDTYHTACNEAKPPLSPYDIDVLTNHRLPKGSVSAGYIRQSFEHLLECQESVTKFLMAKAGAKKKR